MEESMKSSTINFFFFFFLFFSFENFLRSLHLFFFLRFSLI